MCAPIYLHRFIKPKVWKAIDQVVNMDFFWGRMCNSYLHNWYVGVIHLLLCLCTVVLFEFVTIVIYYFGNFLNFLKISILWLTVK